MWDYEYHPKKKESEFNIMSADIISKHCKDLKKSIELGAGTGQLTYLLTQKFSLLSPDLADKSQSSILYIIRYFKDRGLEQYVHYFAFKTDIMALNPERNYDMVFSSGLIEHFKNQNQIHICDIHKSLSKKYVACIVPNATAENMARAETEKHKELYGYEKPMTLQELDALFIDDRFKKIHSETFYKKEKLLIGVYERCE